jgi:hypothetical protein
MTEMVVIEQWFRNRWEARFHLSMGRFSYPRGKHRARSGEQPGAHHRVGQRAKTWRRSGSGTSEFTIGMTAARKQFLPRASGCRLGRPPIATHPKAAPDNPNDKRLPRYPFVEFVSHDAGLPT